MTLAPHGSIGSALVVLTAVSACGPTTVWAQATFVERPPIAVVTEQVVGVAAADLEGDGDTDVFTAEYTNTVAWYENSGATPPAWTQRVISAFRVGAWGGP